MLVAHGFTRYRKELLEPGIIPPGANEVVQADAIVSGFVVDVVIPEHVAEEWVLHGLVVVTNMVPQVPAWGGALSGAFFRDTIANHPRFRLPVRWGQHIACTVGNQSGRAQSFPGIVMVDTSEGPRERAKHAWDAWDFLGRSGHCRAAPPRARSLAPPPAPSCSAAPADALQADDEPSGGGSRGSRGADAEELRQELKPWSTWSDVEPWPQRLVGEARKASGLLQAFVDELVFSLDPDGKAIGGFKNPARCLELVTMAKEWLAVNRLVPR